MLTATDCIISVLEDSCEQKLAEIGHPISSQLSQKAQELLFHEIGYIYNPDFEKLKYEEIEKSILQTELFQGGETSPSNHHSLENLPPYLAELYSIPLLSPEGERVLFQKMNYLKYWVNIYRSEIDPDNPNASLLDEIELLLNEVNTIRNQIIESNLRLIVSIARRFSKKRTFFDELVSEGNTILLKAVEKFDYSRGFRFSTYLTHAVQRHFYRVMKQQQRRNSKEILIQTEVMAEKSCSDDREELSRHEDSLWASQLIKRMDQCLDEREQFIIRERFGFNSTGSARTLKSLAAEIGICKERVRQLQFKALDKLKKLSLEDQTLNYIDT